MITLAMLVFGCYTNHAGFAVSGAPVRLDARKVAISNATETATLPMSAFPEPERRRIAADYVIGHPEAGLGRLLLPDGVRKALDMCERALRRTRLRAEKGLCSVEERDRFCRETSEALLSFLDEKVKNGEILSAERKAIGDAIR